VLLISEDIEKYPAYHKTTDVAENVQEPVAKNIVHLLILVLQEIVN
jgi:hypothetical protein